MARRRSVCGGFAGDLWMATDRRQGAQNERGERLNAGERGRSVQLSRQALSILRRAWSS
jgi:hypothetical protein